MLHFVIACFPLKLQKALAICFLGLSGWNKTLFSHLHTYASTPGLVILLHCSAFFLPKEERPPTALHSSDTSGSHWCPECPSELEV